MLEKLRAAEATEMNALIQTPEFLRAFEGPEEDALIELLCRQRIAELTPVSKALLISSMQLGSTRHRHEVAIRDLFVSSHGADLTAVKQLVDTGPDHRDLAQLIYRDIDSTHLRQEILHHFRSEADAQPHEELRIISDLDDTVYRNWVDPRYPAKTVYPGVLQLHKELDLGHRGDLVLLTGRPGERSGTLENFYRKRLGALGIEGTILTGTWMHQFVHPWVFSMKWANLERHRTLFPEMGVVMFGDTGQADPEFLCEAVERYPKEIRMALLHHVRPISAERMERCERLGLRFFDTYVGAALQLYGAGLIGAEAVWRVVEAAMQELKKITFSSVELRTAREAEFARDIELAMKTLPKTS
jgi:hypothetical protein